MKFTRSQLVAAFAQWIADQRAGKCIDHTIADATPIDQHAELSATALIGYLPPSAVADFQFDLRQVVKIIESDERGTVHARSESTTGEPQYFVRYKSADGRATEQWWSENALQAF